MYKGGDVRGLRITKSDSMTLQGVIIDEIYALEGAAYGIDLSGDVNDRTDWN